MKEVGDGSCTSPRAESLEGETFENFNGGAFANLRTIRHKTHLKVLVEFSVAAPTEAEITLVRSTFRDCLTRAVYRDRSVHVVDTDRPRVRPTMKYQIRVDDTKLKDASRDEAHAAIEEAAGAAHLHIEDLFDAGEESPQAALKVANTDVRGGACVLSDRQCVASTLMVLTGARESLFVAFKGMLAATGLRLAQQLPDPFLQVDSPPQNWPEPQGEHFRAWAVLMPLLSTTGQVEVVTTAAASLEQLVQQVKVTNTDSLGRLYCAGPLRFVVVRADSGEPRICLWILLNVQGDTRGEKNVHLQESVRDDVLQDAGAQGREAHTGSGV